MFIDSNKIAELADNKVDVVVVGAGPAGIALSLKLAKQKKRVLLLEAGGFTPPTVKENDPYVGRVLTRPYPLADSRLRYFGGCSNHWGGWVRPLDKEDFEENTGIPYSGWPINRQALDQYYSEAHRLCEVQEGSYSPEKISAVENLNLFDFDGSVDFRNSIFRFSPPTRFGDKYKNEIKNSSFIFCAVGTQLIRIERSENGKCKLICQDENNNSVIIQSRYYVLAMGGVENARSLLYSNAYKNTGIGGDWVGRNFMDHFALTTSIVLARNEINYDRFPDVSGDVMARISPSREALSQLGASNVMIDIYPVASEQSLGVSYLENHGFSKYTDKGWHYALRLVSGQRPNWNSRVRLDQDLDSNGIPRVMLDWNIQQEDFDNAFMFVDKFANTIGATGQGRLKVEMDQAPDISKPLSVGMHHIGTTRMAKNQSDGVVDSDCKVFGTSDLYVAGSSVFPTSGYSNPTLTILALAVRLADYLSEQLS